MIFAHLVRFSSRPYRQQTGRRGSTEEEAPGLPDYNQVTNGRTALFYSRTQSEYSNEDVIERRMAMGFLPFVGRGDGELAAQTRLRFTEFASTHQTPRTPVSFCPASGGFELGQSSW